MPSILSHVLCVIDCSICQFYDSIVFIWIQSAVLHIPSHQLTKWILLIRCCVQPIADLCSLSILNGPGEDVADEGHEVAVIHTRVICVELGVHLALLGGVAPHQDTFDISHDHRELLWTIAVALLGTQIHRHIVLIVVLLGQDGPRR